MGYRRPLRDREAERAWQRFAEHNARPVAAARLPAAAMESVASWDDFLMHGYVNDIDHVYNSSYLEPAEYAALVQLTQNYFAAGYPFYTPMALAFEDQQALRQRFDPGS